MSKTPRMIHRSYKWFYNRPLTREQRDSVEVEKIKKGEIKNTRYVYSIYYQTEFPDIYTTSEDNQVVWLCIIYKNKVLYYPSNHRITKWVREMYLNYFDYGKIEDGIVMIRRGLARENGLYYFESRSPYEIKAIIHEYFTPPKLKQCKNYIRRGFTETLDEMIHDLNQQSAVDYYNKHPIELEVALGRLTPSEADKLLEEKEDDDK